MKIKNLSFSIFLLQLIMVFLSGCDSLTNSTSGTDSSVVSSEQGMMETENPSEYSTCTVCGGSGKTTGCTNCNNNGWVRCPNCKGSRDDGYGNWGCERCYSEGKEICGTCNGAGVNHISNCSTCKGTGETTYRDCPACENGLMKDPKGELEPFSCWICGGGGKFEYHE